MENRENRAYVENTLQSLSKDLRMCRISEIHLKQKEIHIVELTFTNGSRNRDYKFDLYLSHCTAMEFVYMYMSFETRRFIAIVLPFCKAFIVPSLMSLTSFETNNLLLKLSNMRDVVKTNIKI